MTGPQAPHFVGRAAELSILQDALAVADNGRPTIVVVEGEPGVGKTALLRRFVRDDEASTVVWVSGDESEQALAFGLVDQIRSATGTVDAPTATTSTTADSFSVGAELVRSLGEVGEHGTLVLVVDDVHWIDDASGRALLFWMRRLHTDSVLVLLTIRTDGVEVLGDGWRHLFADQGRCERIRLRGLSGAEIGLLATTAGRRLPGEAIDLLQAHTHGNPLYVETLLDELPDEAFRADAGHLPAPRSYASTVLARVARLSAPAQDLLMAAAVVGLRCPTHVAVALAADDRALDALDEVVGENLVTVSVRDGQQILAFSHPLIRAAVYDDLAPSRRRSLHREASLLLDRPTGLAHRVSGADGFDADLAADLSATTDRDLADGSPRLAAEHLIWSARLQPDRAVAEDCLLDAVELMLISGDVATATSHADEVDRCRPGERRRYVQGTLRAAVGDLDGARTLLREVVAASAPGDRTLFARASASLAIVAVMRGDDEEAVAHARQALEAEPDHPTVRSLARQALGVGLTTSGHADETLALLADLSPSRRTPSPFEPDLLVTRGLTKLWTADFHGAVTELRAVVGWANTGSQPTSLPQVYSLLAEAEHRTGAWDDAITHAEVGVSLGADLDHGWYLTYGHAVAASLYAARGEDRFADEHVAAAHRSLESSWQQHAQAIAAILDADVARTREDWPGVLDACADLPLDTPWLTVTHPGFSSWPLRAAEALAMVGRFDDADAALDRLCRRRAGLGPDTGELARVSAVLAERRGDVPGALAILDDALASDASAGDPFGHARLQLARGRLSLAMHDHGRATQLLTSARTTFIRLGARPYVSTCDKVLAGAGVQADEKAPVALDVLTRKEQIVARMVARGLTNREVAAELYVTTKAIEYHLGNIYAKLAISSRRDLPALVR